MFKSANFNADFFGQLILKRNKKSKNNENIDPRLKPYFKIQTQLEYIQTYPNVTNKEIILCRDCGSDDIKAWGLTSRDDEKRVHSCELCGQILFRSLDAN